MHGGSPRLVDRRAFGGPEVGAAKRSEPGRIPDDLEPVGANVGPSIGGAAVDSALGELRRPEIHAVVDPLPALARAREIEPLVAAALEVGWAPFLRRAVDRIASRGQALRSLPEAAGEALREIDVGVGRARPPDEEEPAAPDGIGAELVGRGIDRRARVDRNAPAIALPGRDPDVEAA